MMRMHAIQTGSVAIKDSQRHGKGHGTMRVLNTLIDRTWTEPLPIYAWVIEHPEGIILVDTGETARTSEPGYFPRMNPYYKLAVRMYVCPEDEIGPQLRAIGISPDDVRWVVLTHLHTDHAGGLHHFPKAEILVARKEYVTARSTAGRLQGYLPHRWPTWFQPRLVDFEEQPLGPFPKSMALTNARDVFLVATEGHTSAHLSVLVQAEKLSFFFAGDTSYTEQLMIEQAVDGVSLNEQVARRTLAYIHEYVQATPTVYLPSHDPAGRERLEKRILVSFTDTALI